MCFLENASNIIPFQSMITLLPKMATEYISHKSDMNVADDPIHVLDTARKDKTANKKDNVTSSFSHSLSDFFLFYEIPK